MVAITTVSIHLPLPLGPIPYSGRNWWQRTVTVALSVLGMAESDPEIFTNAESFGRLRDGLQVPCPITTNGPMQAVFCY